MATRLGDAKLRVELETDEALRRLSAPPVGAGGEQTGPGRDQALMDRISKLEEAARKKGEPQNRRQEEEGIEGKIKSVLRTALTTFSPTETAQAILHATLPVAGPMITGTARAAANLAEIAPMGPGVFEALGGKVSPEVKAAIDAIVGDVMKLKAKDEAFKPTFDFLTQAGRGFTLAGWKPDAGQMSSLIRGFFNITAAELAYERKLTMEGRKAMAEGLTEAAKDAFFR